ncbi:hypothetical protein QDW47_gp11 [Microbacterium phage AnnaLie]|uniref:hypothetical protein n=1 Tax=Microbacterium phage AnnaLie TaxID=2772023 RepID=UPI0018A69191|nr:hypothetical protein QDW47_gp11 [Microbacterium phage AnnaLie]QOC59461.1 hypothetical protein SEA_ANNALIE_11 [Microbacterium phage AnnaLie]QUE25490.1 hypothetical protein SEA_BELMONTSKP_11 [Microbacterium phage BelmontSKP]
MAQSVTTFEVSGAELQEALTATGAKRIKMNKKGVIALLQSAEVQADLAARGEAIAAGLPVDKGEEWAVSNFVGYDRAQTVVRTANHAARLRQAEDNELLRGLDRGR